MPKYLLDTSICIYIAKKSPPQVLKHFEETLVGELGMSIITYAELMFGCEKSQHRQAALNKLKLLTRHIPSISLPDDAAKHYAHIRAMLQKKGTPIGGNDLWIAAHALAQNLTLVTNNTKKFQKVHKLKLENWAS